MKISKRESQTGSTLIIVVLFMALLVGLAILFLLSSLSGVQLSNSSASTAKATNLALGASDTIIGDLRQEIADGSTKTSYTGYGSQVFNTFQPKSSAGAGAVTTAVPALVGFTPQFSTAAPYYETDGLANLLKISKGGVAFYNDATNPNSNYSARGVIRASAVSTSAPSLDGRVISPARWNSHYLIGRQTPNTTSLNSTPIGTTTSTNSNNETVSTFPEQPDWVIVTRSGAQTPYTTAGLPQLSNSSATNAQYAIGRFAYAIYNEGGLLDMNCAGYPSHLTAPQQSLKSSLAFADLTQLSITAPGTPVTTPTLLNQTQVDQIVGWRNAYSAQLGSSYQFGSSTSAFSTTTATSWLNNFALYNNCQTNTTLPNFGLKNGFMSVIGPTGTTSTATDQMFVSRNQLISLVQSLGISLDALQYMGTFSRGIEQPSYAPDSQRPLVGNWITSPAPPPAAGSNNEANYQGNNDAQGGDNQINPAFLSVRVQNSGSGSPTAFTRFNGQPAIVGEPLVLYRFPLSNLAMVAYNATNTTLPSGFAATASDPDPILDHFGLTRTSTSSPWIYNHGSASILTLEQVAALSPSREPDFAELLKAAITVGGLAKGAPNLLPVTDTKGGNSIVETSYTNYQYTIDTTTDYQVLQIMANLIDQQDADSYPTCIQINTGPGGSTVLSGVEDLPYFYRAHLMSIVDQLPNPNLSYLSASNIVYASSNPASTAAPTTPAITRTVSLISKWAFPSGVETTGSTSSPVYSLPLGSGTLGGTTYSPDSITPAAPGVITSPGEVAYLYVPDLWNPHDPTTASQNPSLRPTNFRIWAQTAPPATPPVTSPATGVWSIGAVTVYNRTASTPTQDLTPANDGNNPPLTYYQPVSAAVPFNQANTELDFSDNKGSLFREPTLLWNNNPTGIGLSAPSTNTLAPITDANTLKQYYGIVAGKCPILMQFSISSTPPQTSAYSLNFTIGGTSYVGSQSPDGTYVAQAGQVSNSSYVTAISNAVQKITFYLQCEDASGNWITYDVKSPALYETSTPSVVANTSDYTGYKNPYATTQLAGVISAVEPRTARWGMGNQLVGGRYSPTNTGVRPASSQAVGYLLEPTANANVLGTASANYTAMGSTDFSVYETTRPRADKGDYVSYLNPGNVNSPGMNVEMRLFGGQGFSLLSGVNNSPYFFDGLLTQNIPSALGSGSGYTGLNILARDSATETQLSFEDADGVCRRAMGAYASTTLTDPSTSDLAETISASNPRIGLPEATASTFDNNAVATPTQQAQSRPIILNRPFRSVSEMSYAFTGTPWKNIDFFTPESAYPALLDTFCVGQPPASGLVAGKVDLNTRQVSVVQAVVSGASRDEWNNIATPPTYALPPLTSAEAGLIAQRLVAYTTDFTHLWRGPLSNVSELVGRYIPNMASGPTVLTTGASPDWYTYNPPAYNTTDSQASDPGLANTFSSKKYTYAGFTGLLDSSVYTASTNNTNIVAPIIQRFKEAGLRPLADCGQTRVWNLLIDVIAQSGKYPKSATGLDQFAVDGEKRMWIHVAIDRQTGEVLDKQIEVINQ